MAWKVSVPWTHRARRDRSSALGTLLVIDGFGIGILFPMLGEYKAFGTQFTLGTGFEGWIERFRAHASALRN
jgi:hypothetical protein